MNETFALVNSLKDFLAQHSAEFISALGGAFFGAWFANLLQTRAEARKILDEQHFVLVRAQWALISQATVLLNIQKQCLDPLRNDPARARKMIRFTASGTDLRIDFAPLAFVLMTKDADLLQQLDLAERSYMTAIDTLRERNQAFDKLHRDSHVESMNVQTGACTVAADGRDIKLLQDTTDALYATVDRALTRCSENVKEIARLGKSLFPGRTFVAMKALETAE